MKEYHPRLSQSEVEFLIHVLDLVLDNINNLRLIKEELLNNIRTIQMGIIDGRLPTSHIMRLRWYRRLLKRYSLISPSDLICENELFIFCTDFKKRFEAILDGRYRRRESLSFDYKEPFILNQS